jgi:hypothetical protein
MAKERLFNLPETKGVYQLRGIVTGTASERFYQNSKTSTGKDKRSVNFGVEVEKGKTLYVGMQGFPRDEVFFFKRGENGQKGTTERVKWANRHTFNKEGFNLIGVNVGLTKTVTADGNMKNDNKTMVEFDACQHIGTNLKDDMSVFVRGGIEYSSFTDDKGALRRFTKFVPNQISLCAKPIDFDDEKFEAQHDFTQTIVFMGIEQEKEDDKATGRFIVSAKIVTYSTIEDVAFVIADSKLASSFRKNLKPYMAITVWGKLDATTLTEEVEDDCWGESNKMNKVTASTRREMIITGADPKSIDSTVYTQAEVESAMIKIRNAQNAQKDYGESNNSGWGDPSALAVDNEDDDLDW